MTNSKATLFAAIATCAALLPTGCSAGGSSTLSSGLVPAGAAQKGAPALPRVTGSFGRSVRADTCAGNGVYVADYKNSVVDSFPATGGSSACTVTKNGISNPIGIWVQPVAGVYYNDLFVANSGNGTAVAFKTPIHNTSKPTWQFNTGGLPSDVVQDMFGNVYVAIYGTPKIDVFTPPFDACAYPTGCSAAYGITDPCGSVYWLATDGKGDVYSNNYCGYVSLFVAPVRASAVGSPLSGASYVDPGGMIVDRHNRLIVNDPGSDKITTYGLDVLDGVAVPAFSLALYSGDILGIGLDKSDKFLWGANAALTQGQEYPFTSGGAGPVAITGDPTLVYPMGTAARPASDE